MTVAYPCTIRVHGAFDVIDASGRSMRPSGRKDCALLAMLALAKGRRQSRAWLQDRLWGDRAPAQAAASLRQSLTVLRALLNDGRDAIRADRTWVWLEPGAIAPERIAEAPTGAGADEVLRGFDLREEGFNDWLREARATAAFLRSDTAVPARLDRADGQADRHADRIERRWHIDLPHHVAGDARLADFAHLLTDALLEATAVIGLNTVVDRRAAPSAPPPASTDLIVRAKMVGIGGDAVASLSVTTGFGTLLWQIRREVSLNAWTSVRAALTELAQQFQGFAIHSEAERLSDARWSASANGCRALTGLLVPGSVPVEEMLRCSRNAIAGAGQGIHHALLGHAQLRVVGEREPVTPPDAEEIMETMRRALRLSPSNGLAHALVGHAYGYVARDLDRNDAMTREAVRLLPTNGACWIYRAISLVYTGRPAEALRAVETAVSLCRGTMSYPLARFTQLYARLMAGDVRGAVRSGEEAVDLIVFRPAIMDLMTAYALSGDTDKGRATLDLLVAREPDLCVEMFRSPAYPIINADHRGLVVDASRRLGLH